MSSVFCVLYSILRKASIQQVSVDQSLIYLILFYDSFNLRFQRKRGGGAGAEGMVEGGARISSQLHAVCRA